MHYKTSFPHSGYMKSLEIYKNYITPLCLEKKLYDNIIFYVTDGNIMYLTDASRFLISCVIQHYAPVVGWGGGGGTDA